MSLFDTPSSISDSTAPATVVESSNKRPKYGGRASHPCWKSVFGFDSPEDQTVSSCKHCKKVVSHFQHIKRVLSHAKDCAKFNRWWQEEGEKPDFVDWEIDMKAKQSSMNSFAIPKMTTD